MTTTFDVTELQPLRLATYSHTAKDTHYGCVMNLMCWEKGLKPGQAGYGDNPEGYDAKLQEDIIRLNDNLCTELGREEITVEVHSCVCQLDNVDCACTDDNDGYCCGTACVDCKWWPRTDFVNLNCPTCSEVILDLAHLTNTSEQLRNQAASRGRLTGFIELQSALTMITYSIYGHANFFYKKSLVKPGQKYVDKTVSAERRKWRRQTVKVRKEIRAWMDRYREFCAEVEFELSPTTTVEALKFFNELQSGKIPA